MQEKEKRRNSQDIKFLLRARSGPKMAGISTKF
jgi:hypothetical protein